MARVTWKGDDSDTKEMEWMGVKFEKGKAVDTDDGQLIEKARNNPYFELEGGPKSGTKVDTQGQKMEDQGKEAKHPETGQPTHNPAVASTSNPPGTSPLPPGQRGGQPPEKQDPQAKGEKK